MTSPADRLNEIGRIFLYVPAVGGVDYAPVDDRAKVLLVLDRIGGGETKQKGHEKILAEHHQSDEHGEEKEHRALVVEEAPIRNLPQIDVNGGIEDLLRGNERAHEDTYGPHASKLEQRDGHHYQYKHAEKGASLMRKEFEYIKKIAAFY